MDTTAVATAFADLCKAGQFFEAGQRFWADDVVSRECFEGPQAVATGKAAVIGKSEWWYANHEVHSGVATGPWVHGEQFAMHFAIDVTPKGGERMQMAEIGLYTVRGGKVVEERFFNAPMG
jgi:hypothetical protein